MPGPACAGLSIYAKVKQRIPEFHEVIIGMSRIHDVADVTVLQSSDIQLAVHRIPEEKTSNVLISTPPQLRDAALKFFFTVPGISEARSRARKLGGDIADEQWEGPGFIVCNGNDPEGNVFHVRERVA